jgi:serine/threonine-protein kinase
MNEPETPAPETDVLDEYLARLQAGERPDRAALLRQHPELESLLDCIEALDGFAPAAVHRRRSESGSGALDEASSAPGEADPAASSAGPLPRDFGDYELLEEVGRGGMGVVYRARQKTLGREVALKMILPGQLASAEHVRRFRAEARLAARVRHPNVIAVYEVGTYGGQHFFAMELVQGRSLEARLADERPDPLASARLLAKVARAVGHLHRSGLVHRDLKPSNILLTGDDWPIVTDFGLAKLLAPDETRSATGIVAGTPSYMAPEQAAGDGRRVGAHSDIYSLGAILYEVLTGRPPFEHENPLETLLQVVAGEPPLPRRIDPAIPRALQQICLKCMAKRLEARYASAEALAADLERAARGEAIQAKPPNAWRRLGRWARRQPALASRLAAFGVFYVVEMANFALGRVDAEFHYRVSAILAVWAAASVLLQRLLAHRRWAVPARFGWGTLDVLMFLALLLTADGLASPLVVGFPLLIAGSGLWFRVRFVGYMTALCLGAYLVLLFDFYVRRPELSERVDPNFDRHTISIVAMLVLAAVVAYLVARVRTLSAFCGGELD